VPADGQANVAGLARDAGQAPSDGQADVAGLAPEGGHMPEVVPVDDPVVRSGRRRRS
jgi:hypothetical protein